jgi:CspA family cold shock protein
MGNQEQGTVKWYNTEKGYGFIVPEDGGGDIFVHVSAVEKAGLKKLDENQKVGFDRETNPRNSKTSAVNINLIS